MNCSTRFLAALTLAVMVSATAAHAHAEGETTVFNIPFEFTVGGISLPEGQYVFERETPFIYQIRDLNGHGVFATASAAILPGGLTEKSSLKFATVSGRHVLVQIWNHGTATAYEFPSNNLPSNSADPAGVSTTVEQGNRQLEL